MDTRQQKNKSVSTDEWYTPQWIIDLLGPFDLDPCSPGVWLNPPYSRPLVEQFIRKMADHNNGIALLVNRQDNVMWQEVIFPTAASMIFMRHRVQFLTHDGHAGKPFFGSCLVAWGKENDAVLRCCGIEGKYVILNEV